jgi:hypothetical protein
LLAVGATVCALSGAARADGDPASDYLLAQNVFLPVAQTVDPGEAQRLTTALRDANAAGFRIKVALIAQPSDLGSVFQLFDKPQMYAEFLGQEIFYVYRGPLLVVMRNGLGLSRGGKPEPRLQRSLIGLRPGESATELARVGTTAVVRLARTAGHPITAPPETSSGDNRASDRVKIAALAVTAAVIAVAIGWFRRSRLAAQ